MILRRADVRWVKYESTISFSSTVFKSPRLNRSAGQTETLSFLSLFGQAR